MFEVCKRLIKMIHFSLGIYLAARLCSQGTGKHRGPMSEELSGVTGPVRESSQFCMPGELEGPQSFIVQLLSGS